MLPWVDHDKYWAPIEKEFGEKLKGKKIKAYFTAMQTIATKRQ